MSVTTTESTSVDTITAPTRRVVRTPAEQQFLAMGIPPVDWTASMRLAIKQHWSGLPVDVKVSELRDRLDKVTVDRSYPTEDALRASLEAAGEPLAAEAAKREHARLKRNAGVTAWRERSKLQAALDARDLKFKALRAKATKPKVDA